MPAASAAGPHVTLGVSSSKTRNWIILAAAVTASLAFLIAASVIYWHAIQDRHGIVHRGLSASAAASHILDREAEALGNILKGLSTSPLLKAEDLKPFHQQLRATPRPSGSRFVLWNQERLLLNSAFAYGAPLPPINVLPISEQRLQLLRRVGVVMSERIQAPLTGEWIVAVSLRLGSPDLGGERILTLAVPEAHLGKVVRDSAPPVGWTVFILDHKLQHVKWNDAELPLASQLHPQLAKALASGEHNGHFEVDGDGGTILVAFERSDNTGYIVLSTIPTALINEPLYLARRWIWYAGIILALAGIGSAALILRNIGSIDALKVSAVSTRAELVETNERLAAILTSVSDCYLTLDRTYRITDINAAAIRWFGLPRTDVIGHSYFDIVGHHPQFDAALKKALESETPFHGEFPSTYNPGKHIDYRVEPTRQGVSVFFRDVTEQYRARLSLMQEREFLQASLDALSVHVAVLDNAGTIISVNEAWHRFARENGYPGPSHGLGMNYLDVCARAGEYDLAARQIHTGLKAVTSGQRHDYRDVYRCDGPGEPRWFQMRATRFIAGELSRIIVTHEDITEVVAVKAEITALSGRLLTVQEEERERIAVELHDSTAQHLVAVSLNLMQVENFCLPPSGRRILDEIDRSLEEALKELRIFTYLLHPPRLETDGLVSTVQSFTEGFSKRTNLRTILRFDESADDLPVDLQRALFRIIQEGLTNVHRHAGASEVILNLRLTSDQVILFVADNGRGMRSRRGEPAVRQPTLGVGIPGMRIRLSQFGGSLQIRSGRRGTIIRATAPRFIPVVAALKA
ncbi:PAS domain-containing protein [Microvirga sp. VF16]|uniref:sensor histidine kinase n=1 Tax=Microvirga sp. VF16 TaxID=2807101 RepID=UPI00193E7E32|nr:PAS domain-containing protein [Microvirga sp. VF16]QRM31280.1 PAS domain-containing protein [Microvirga sp. VF16]